MKILLGVSGSIAAYKAALLTRLWVKRGDEVQVLMTESATGFIAPLSLSTLSKHEVFDRCPLRNGLEQPRRTRSVGRCPGGGAGQCQHPGQTGQRLVRQYFKRGIPLGALPCFCSPGHGCGHGHHPATQSNLRRLQDHGVRVIPVVGELASGLVGDGRMAEPEEIVAFVEKSLAEHSAPKPLSGKKALITAGPTHEPLDPVRFLGNNSSGKMGIAIAESLAANGAEVTLVLGPTDLRPQNPAIKVQHVTTAQDMFEACSGIFPQSDITVLAAAVADYRPKTFSETKIKKKEGDLTLELAKTVDIAATLGRTKRAGQMLVGFALETNDETRHALEKLEKKNLDFIVLNSLRDPGAGIGYDTNKISILHRDGARTDFDLKSKTAVGADIVAEIVRLANQKGA